MIFFYHRIKVTSCIVVVLHYNKEVTLTLLLLSERKPSYTSPFTPYLKFNNFAYTKL